MIYSLKKISSYVVLIIALSITALNAQINNFKKWTIREGLSQSDVYSVTQDHRGYLWIGTSAGISVFDGKTFVNYAKKDGLCGNVVRAIFEDSKKRIWLASENGVSVYDGKKFTRINQEQGFKGHSATAITELKNKIFVSTDDGGINIISDSTNGKYKINYLSDENGLSSNTIFSLITDKHNRIWAATYGGGINIISYINNKLNVQVFKGFDKIPSDNLYALNIDNDENLWISAEEVGVIKIKVNQFLNNNYSYQFINDKNGLTSKTIWCILPAKNNEVWFGTLDNGVYRLNDGKISQYSVNEGLNGNQVLSLFQDQNRHVWIGMQGEGLAMLQGDYFSHYSKNNGLSDNKVQAIVKDNFQNYWLATSEGGLINMKLENGKPKFTVFNESLGLPTNELSCLAFGNTTNTNLWIGTNEKGIVKFDGKNFTNYTTNNDLSNNSVYSICVDDKGIVWCGTADGISRFDGVKFLNVSTEKMLMQNEGVKSIVCDKTGNVWFATAGGIARYGGNEKLRTFDEVEGLKFKDVNSLAVDKNDHIWIGTNGGGIYKFDKKKNDTVAISIELNELQLSSGIIKSMIFLNDSTLIAGTFKGFDRITFDKKFKVKSVLNYNANDGFIGQECNENALFLDTDQTVWFGTVKGLTKYIPNKEHHTKLPPSLEITDIQLFYKSINWKEKGEILSSWESSPNKNIFGYSENHLTFKFNAAVLDNPEKLFYSYILEGKETQWSPAKPNAEITYSGLEPGKYIFKVRAIDASAIWSEPQTFSFEITPPWYKTKIFYISSILLLIISIVSYVKWREKKLVKEKENLERIVDEKTLEIREQKEHLAEKHKEITDSINYAERIQKSFMATKELLDKNLLEYFVMFKPKEAVSGDFYWADNLSNGNFIIVTADSTGHGVPGAIMSLLNITSIEKAVEHLTNPADILNHTRQTIINRLKRDGSAEGGKDGMDCSLCAYDFNNKKLILSAANNPVWIVRGIEVIEIKADKMPVGKHDKQDVSFTQQEIDLQEGDIVYTLTDGFPDQFGGEKGKKFMSKNLRALLLKNSTLTMTEQKQLLEEAFANWVGNLEQIDDVTVIGVKIKN